MSDESAEGDAVEAQTESRNRHKESTQWFCHPCSSPLRPTRILSAVSHFLSPNLSWFPLLKTRVLNSNIAESAEGQFRLSHSLGYSSQKREKEGRERRRMGRHQGGWKEGGTEAKGGKKGERKEGRMEKGRDKRRGYFPYVLSRVTIPQASYSAPR